RYNGASARDPKVIRDARGTYHMFLTTTLRAEGRGCLAHLTSPDADVWHEEDEPIYIAPGRNEPECCDYFELNGWYYLVFSLRGQGRYLYSRQPFGGWREPMEPVIPCKSVPKAAVWNGRIIFAGFDGRGQYAGTMTFLETFQGANGELIYGPQKP
ncbi:MAG: glycosyl hydrolase, partial [Clostridia bacterium]|nr:glycosyl hydrolase [Clostridia bacterium]